MSSIVTGTAVEPTIMTLKSRLREVRECVNLIGCTAAFEEEFKRRLKIIVEQIRSDMGGTTSAADVLDHLPDDYQLSGAALSLYHDLSNWLDQYEV